MNLSIVVPIYKGEMFIEPLVAQLSKTLPTFTERYEIILVNDGSPDNSWSVIEKLSAVRPATGTMPFMTDTSILATSTLARKTGC